MGQALGLSGGNGACLSLGPWIAYDGTSVGGPRRSGF